MAKQNYVNKILEDSIWSDRRALRNMSSSKAVDSYEDAKNRSLLKKLDVAGSARVIVVDSDLNLLQKCACLVRGLFGKSSHAESIKHADSGDVSQEKINQLLDNKQDEITAVEEDDFIKDYNP